MQLNAASHLHAGASGQSAPRPGCFLSTRRPPRRIQCQALHGCRDASTPEPAQAECARRRLLLAAGMASLISQGAVVQASAAGFNKYLKKKQLDPLETYVPLVLEARQQLDQLPNSYEEPLEARKLLRSGPFSGLRDNIRALGEYAVIGSSSGSSQDQAAAGQLVTNFFRSLEDLDLLLYQTVRDKKDLDQGAAAAKLQATTAALDALLATVPAEALAAAQKVLDRVYGKQQQAATSSNSSSDEAAAGGGSSEDLVKSMMVEGAFSP